MTQREDSENTIQIQIECWKNGSYTAWLVNDEYKGVIVNGASIGNCVKELGISLEALEKYRTNLKAKNVPPANT